MQDIWSGGTRRIHQLRDEVVETMKDKKFHIYPVVTERNKVMNDGQKPKQLRVSLEEAKRFYDTAHHS